MKRITVLGGGILGSEIAKQAKILGGRVRLVSRSFSEVERTDTEIQLVSGDASDPEFIKTALQDTDDLVVVFGGMRPYQAELNPDKNLRLIEESLSTILSAAAESDLSSFSYVSSGGAVYGESVDGHYFDELDPPNPTTAYGRGKLAAEKMLLAREFSSSTKVRIFRVSNVYGRGAIRDENFGFIEHAIAAGRNNSELQIFGDGEDHRDFIPAEVASQQIASVMLLQDAPAIVNIANGVSYSLNEIVGMIEKITGREIRTERLERRTCDLRNSRLNVALLRELTGFEPPDLKRELTNILGSKQ